MAHFHRNPRNYPGDFVNEFHYEIGAMFCNSFLYAGIFYRLTIDRFI